MSVTLYEWKVHRKTLVINNLHNTNKKINENK